MTSEEQYFAGDELALHAWESKYRSGNESLDGFFERIESEFTRLDNFKNAETLSDERLQALSEYGRARIPLKRDEIFSTLFKDFKYIIPGGSVLAGIGSNKPVSLSNCFVIPTDDSIEDIFSSATDMSQIYKRRGGVGVDLSTLRPAKAKVNNAAKTTGGVVPFMELYSQVTNTIGQEGRRGALMLSIDINHPDSPEFVTIKQNLTKVTGANVSVRLNGEFMEAVETDSDYLLRWPCDIPQDDILFPTDNLNYNELYLAGVISTHKNCYIKMIRAKELWESIIHCAWNTAEPGILFWDNIIDNDPASVYPQFRAVSTNPCGEIPLSPYDSCRLIATNVFGLVKYPFTEDAIIIEEEAYKVFYEAQIIGDILVDLELEAVEKIIILTTGKERELWEQIYRIGQSGRRTGVGITGLADMLAALDKPYTDIETIDKIMSIKMQAELDASIDLAIINGTFPAYDKDLEYGTRVDDEYDLEQYFGRNTFYDNLMFIFPDQWKKMQKWGRKNCSWSTIAPTGTISILAGTSSGCEPVFSIYYTRRKKCNPGEVPDFVDQNGVGFKNYNVVHGKFKEWYGIKYFLSPDVVEAQLAVWSKEVLDKLISESPWANNTAEDIEPASRVMVQAILQKYTTHSISSTVNVAENTPESDIAIIYSEAHKRGCKGITVNR
jgi:ribonucleoside-diphosphate reductase alpha chain